MGVRGGDQASEASGARAEGPWSSLRPTANRIAGRDRARAEQPYPHGPRRNFHAVRCHHARSAKRRVCRAWRFPPESDCPFIGRIRLREQEGE